jgi:hypothetical protein
MLQALYLSMVLILAFIAYQDFKFRAVTWFLFPLLAIVIIIENYFLLPLSLLFYPFLINFLFFGIQLVLITIYLSLKKKTLIKVWENYLGLGDILFFIILCLFFSPINFILFYLISLVFTILAVFIINRRSKVITLIPLAGIQSLMLMALVILNLFATSVNYKIDINLFGLLS